MALFPVNPIVLKNTIKTLQIIPANSVLVVVKLAIITLVA